MSVSVSKKLHPDDPRAWCHCRLLRRPVAKCESGVCRRPVASSDRPWQIPDAFAPYETPGMGSGNGWRGNDGVQV